LPPTLLQHFQVLDPNLNIHFIYSHLWIHLNFILLRCNYFHLYLTPDFLLLLHPFQLLFHFRKHLTILYYYLILLVQFKCLYLNFILHFGSQKYNHLAIHFLIMNFAKINLKCHQHSLNSKSFLLYHSHPQYHYLFSPLINLQFSPTLKYFLHYHHLYLTRHYHLK